MTNFKGKAIMCYKFFIENFDMIAQKQIFLVLHKSPVSHQYSGVQLTFIIELFVTLTRNMSRTEFVPSYEEGVPELQSQHSQL